MNPEQRSRFLDMQELMGQILEWEKELLSEREASVLRDAVIVIEDVVSRNPCEDWEYVDD